MSAPLRPSTISIGLIRQLEDAVIKCAKDDKASVEYSQARTAIEERFAMLEARSAKWSKVQTLYNNFREIFDDVR